MPPKFKFTKEEIITAATDIVRESGTAALTARNLAEKLGSSPKPVFGLFENMDEVRGEVIKAATEIYSSYIRFEAEGGKYPPYKASGMGYIRFASEEKELFKLLFMRDRTEEQIGDGKEELKPVLALIRQNLGISEDEAYLMHLEMWIYVHGIATMIATNYLTWDMDFASKALTDVYRGLVLRYGEKQ